LRNDDRDEVYKVSPPPFSFFSDQSAEREMPFVSRDIRVINLRDGNELCFGVKKRKKGQTYGLRT
jgi:hypothetical protein